MSRDTQNKKNPDGQALMRELAKNNKTFEEFSESFNKLSKAEQKALEEAAVEFLRRHKPAPKKPGTPLPKK
jgi:hypothetical protein